MHKTRVFKGVLLGLLILALSAGGPSLVFALEPISTSENYQMVDTGFEGTSGQEGCSDGYCVQSSIETGDGVPLLEVTVSSSGSDFKNLSINEVAHKTATITVKSYLSFGYTVQIVGDSPTYQDHTIATPNTPLEIQPGVEQFGINLVANTSPLVGADPVQAPDGETSFGLVNPGYDQANKFKYSSGETVAHGISTMEQVGQTTYTVSMAMAISNVTPAGIYSTDLSVVVVPIY